LVILFESFRKGGITKMSRIGNKPITVPAEVQVKIDGQNVTVTGPKGTLERTVHKNMTVKLDGNVITVSRIDDEPTNRSLHGLTRTLINNMIIGVTSEYSKELQINGVGYRVQKQGNNLKLTLGYSHPVIFEAPAGITFDVPNPNTIIVKGIDKELVGQTAAVIRTKRPPEVYRGKGIKYADEVIRRKEGKTGK
jgi:large subunit ribosomal protein L6